MRTKNQRVPASQPEDCRQTSAIDASATAQTRPEHTPDTQAKAPLLPLPQDCVVGSFVQRRKRFSVELALNGEPLWVHSNNSGSMLGLTLPGSPVLVDLAARAVLAVGTVVLQALVLLAALVVLAVRAMRASSGRAICLAAAGRCCHCRPLR